MTRLIPFYSPFFAVEWIIGIVKEVKAVKALEYAPTNNLAHSIDNF
jgi:hypothetical protein